MFPFLMMMVQLAGRQVAVVYRTVSLSSGSPTMSSILLTEAARTGSFSLSLDRITCVHARRHLPAVPAHPTLHSCKQT